VSSEPRATSLARSPKLTARSYSGGLAQLARASALHAEGHRFDSDILHTIDNLQQAIGNGTVLNIFDVTLGLKIHNLNISTLLEARSSKLEAYSRKLFDILGK
jgi:hypothetical protein